MEQTIKCPVCAKVYAITESFCPVCGYEIHILPKDGSVAVSEYEKTRFENYKKIWDSLNESQNNLSDLNKQLLEQKENNKLLAKDNKRLQSELNEALSRPVEEPIQAYLILGMDEEMCDGIVHRIVKDVFPLYTGKNIIGKMPKADNDVHVNRVLLGEGVHNEHFLIEGRTDGSFVVQKISGVTCIRNSSNKIDKPTEIYNEDDIFIGNIIFTFVENNK